MIRVLYIQFMNNFLKDKVIDGVECFNFLEYYPIAFDYANKYNLAYMGNSDIHNLVTETYGGEKLARPITLVFFLLNDLKKE